MHRFLPLIFGVIFLAACAAPVDTTPLPSPILLTATPTPDQTSTLTSTITIPPTETPTPEPVYRTGLEGITDMSQCNKLDTTKLDTQMPNLVAKSQEAYAAIGNDVNYGYAFDFSGIDRSADTPWSLANINIIATDASTISCNILHTDHGDEFSITIPMKAPGSDRVIPMTFVMDRKGLEAWWPINDPQGTVPVSEVMPETLFPQILVALESGKAVISLRPWLSMSGDLPELFDQWPTSKMLLEKYNTQPPWNSSNLPTPNEISSIRTGFLLKLFLEDEGGSYYSPELRNAIADELIKRAPMFPVQMIGVLDH
jgi:hypothetical protein